MKIKLYWYVVIAVLVIGAVSLPVNASASGSVATGKSAPAVFNSPNLATTSIRTMQVDYPNYSTSRSVVAQWETNMKAAGINMVVLNAGRGEWTYFKWAGHNSSWSSDVTSTGVDFLADDLNRYGQWAQINALIDILAPNYVSAHPDKAAVSATGQKSTDLVSTAELVNGAYGQTLLDMVGYIAANYPKVASITINAISYHVDGYGADDLALFKAASGKTDWPRNKDGSININDASIGNWRSAAVGQFLSRAAALAHQNGKQLFVEVGVSVNSLSTATNNYGTNYSVMLKNVDRIVVQGYFGADGYAPKYSSNIAKYLATLGTSRSILSIGLWGASGGTVSSTDMKTAITSAQSGGIPNIWVAPGSMATTSHWQALASLWGSQTPAATATPGPTNTPVKTATAVNTPVPTNTPLPTAKPTNTALPTVKPTNTAVPTNTPVPTAKPTNTAVPTNTSVPTAKPTNTAVPTNTSVPTAKPTNTAVPTNTPVPTAKPTNTPLPTATNTPVPASNGTRIMRVEYANYANSRAEVPTWTTEMQAAGINMVALAAGRTEWAYFKWAGHTADQSSDVTDTGIDFLADDSTTYSKFAQVNAVIDVFAPNYIQANPSKAAIDATGTPSTDLVSTAELVNGAFGQKLLAMVQYIAANYPHVNSISITELSYRVDGYGPDDLALFKTATGRTDWPRNSDGSINIDDPVIGNWRSAVMGQFLGRATAIAHQYGKQMYFDVSVSYGNLPLMTNNLGTNYNVMLQNVDKIVVWDYFPLAGYPASYSLNIAQYLTTFGLGRTILSVGLWAPNNATVSAADFQTAILASQAGGMPDIWICPGSMMTAAHWQVLDSLWGPH